MAIAAVPGYLGQDHSQASPGLRFGMYLPLWGVDSRTGQPSWTTHDLNERTSGPRQELREFKDENKSAALKRALKLGSRDLALMRAVADRQSAAAAAQAAAGHLLRLDALCIAPFTTGLGNEHPLENGFAFLNPYGLPYLPGSGVKGVLRQAAHELHNGDWGDSKGWTQDAITYLFGLKSDDGDKNHQRGALSFWDVLPQLPGDSLQVEVMTPHQSHYYQQRSDAKSGGSATPHDSGQPNPIHFVTVPPRSRFAFHVRCDVPLLARHAKDLAEGGRWQVLLRGAFEHAFAWLGFGAKTAVGYGMMEIDVERERKAAQLQQERAQALAEQRRQEEREAAKTKMSPADRAVADLYDQRIDKNQDERSVLFSALKAGKLGEHRTAAAERLKTLMQQQGRWRERSEKKNPDKDQPYQDTLQVKKWLNS
jgi:CRISPR-associated protein Cmr6